MAFEFDLAISYASDTRDVAVELAERLTSAGYRVFYDRREQHALTGRDGVQALSDVYGRSARLCVLLLSPGYDSSEWTAVERDALLRRERIDPTNFVVPVLVRGDPPAWLGKRRLRFDLEKLGMPELLDLLTKRAGARGAVRAAPEILWTAAVGIGTWKHDPIPHGDDIYVASAGSAWNVPDELDGVHCLSRRDGAKQWHVHTDADANAMVLDDGVLFVGTDAGSLYAIDTDSGSELWRVRGGGDAILARPLVIGDRLITFSAGGRIGVVDRATGAHAIPRSASPRAGGGYVGAVRGGVVADPVRHGDVVFVVSRAGVIFELPVSDPIPSTDLRPEDFPQRSLTLTTLSQYELDGKAPCGFHGTPVILGEFLLLPYVRDTYFPRVPLAAVECRRMREHFGAAAGDDAERTFGNVRARPAVCDGLAVVPVSYGREVIACEANGHIRWIQSCGIPYFYQFGSPAAYGRDVLVPRFDGFLHALRARDGEKRWAMDLGGGDHTGTVISGDDLDPGDVPGAEWENTASDSLNAPVSIAGDVAFVHSSGGKLYAIGLPPATS